MFWFVVIGLFAAFYYIYQLEKRLKSIEETRGPKWSCRFRVEALDAVMSNKHFAELVGLKSATKQYEDWSKADQDLWQKGLGSQINKDSMVYLLYLANENAFFVRPVNDTPYIVLRGETTNMLYSKTIVGDKDGIESHLDLEIYERLVKQSNGKYEWLITTCLHYVDKDFLSGKNDFEVLSEYPFLEDVNDEQWRDRGFNFEEKGGDDVYVDSFGKHRSIPRDLSLTKNGVKIKLTY